MNHLGLFSGIGGFEEAFRRAGANLIGICEIEPKAQMVLRRHFPGVRIINDVKKIKKDTFGGTPIDLITGGFPCQDVSVAGRRAGLDGERSGLWFEYLRIIDLFRPRWVEIENVPGLLSSNGGRDFAIILRGLVELGYGVAWRVFDSQFDGVAQRRERVFIVGHLGEIRGWPLQNTGRISSLPAEVLFERSSEAWNSPPSREAGQGVAASVEAGAFAPLVAKPLRSSGPGASRVGDSRGQDTLIAFSSKDYGHDSQADISPTLRSMNFDKSHINGGGQIAIAFTERTRAEGRTLETQEDLAYSLTDASKGGNPHSSKIAGSFGVRRLTPRECERLQGFADDWTRWGDDGKEISDSARYRMLGNAVCLLTVEWIARRILNAKEK